MDSHTNQVDYRCTDPYRCVWMKRSLNVGRGKEDRRQTSPIERKRSVSVRPIALFVASALVVTACQSPSTELSSDDIATIREMFDTTVEAFNSGNMEPWVAMWAEDAVLHPPNAPMVEGRDAIAAFGEAFPDMEEMTFSGVRVWGKGDLAWGVSAYSMTLVGVAPDTGKQLVVFKRSEAGTWEVVAASFNSDLPVPEPGDGAQTPSE